MQSVRLIIYIIRIFFIILKLKRIICLFSEYLSKNNWRFHFIVCNISIDVERKLLWEIFIEIRNSLLKLYFLM